MKKDLLCLRKHITIKEVIVVRTSASTVHGVLAKLNPAIPKMISSKIKNECTSTGNRQNIFDV
jgi:hypothetical protein